MPLNMDCTQAVSLVSGVSVCLTDTDTKVTVFLRGDRVASCRLCFGNRTFAAAIREHLRRVYGMTVSLTKAKTILHTIGSVYPLSCERGMVIADGSCVIAVTSEEIRDVLRSFMGETTAAIRRFLRVLSPIKRHEIQRGGLYMEGTVPRGMALLLLEEAMGAMECHRF